MTALLPRTRFAATHLVLSAVFVRQASQGTTRAAVLVSRTRMVYVNVSQQTWLDTSKIAVCAYKGACELPLCLSHRLVD